MYRGFSTQARRIAAIPNPDPREDPKNRSLKGVPIKYPFVVRVPNQGIYFLDPPGGLGSGTSEAGSIKPAFPGS